jgi:hypothetical protein
VRVPFGRVWCSVRQYAYHAIFELSEPGRRQPGYLSLSKKL